MDSGQCIARTEGIHLSVRALNQMGEVAWCRRIYVSTHPGVAPSESKWIWCLHPPPRPMEPNYSGGGEGHRALDCANHCADGSRFRDFSKGVIPTLWRAPARVGQDYGCKFSIPVIQTSLFLAGSRGHLGKAPLSEKCICSEVGNAPSIERGGQTG